MQNFREEVLAFGARKAEEVTEARQIAAMRLVCGMDLPQVLAASPEVRSGLIRRIERILERERLKGMRRHWSYDLNRHIALKQVLDRLREMGGGVSAVDKRHGTKRAREKAYGAGRRRCRI